MSPDGSAPRAYRRLLLLYPPAFRRRFAVDMCHTFGVRLAEVRARGRAATAAFWLRSGIEALVFGSLERLRSLGGGLSTRPPDHDGPGRSSERWMSLARDLRLAFRSLRRRPALALASIVALGLGIGLTATTFSIAWGTILRGLPFERSEELVHFERSSTEGDVSLSVTPHDYAYWQERQTTFEGLGAYVEALAHLTDATGSVRRLWGVYIDPPSFGLLRVEPALGRVFSAEDAGPGAPDVILLSHRLWRSEFGGDSTVVGRTIDVNGGPVTVVGVMPEGFGFPIAEQFWRPLRLDFTRLERGEGRLDVFGRVAPGVRIGRARAEFGRIGGSLATAYPDTNGDVRPVLRTFREEYVGPEFTRLVYAMVAGAVLVLLIACANVSNLLAARAMARTREVAVRTALGAGRLRILSRFLAETVVLAAAGAALGILLARVGVTWFAAGAEAGAFRLPHGGDSLFWWDVEVSAVPLLFVLGVTLLTSLLAGAAPAARALATEAGEVLKDEGRSGGGRRLSRFTRALVVGEIALTTGLLVAAGLMVKSVLNASGVGDTIDTDGILTARIALPLEAVGISEEDYPDHESRLAYFESLLRDVQARPGVVTATGTTTLPTAPGGRTRFALPDGSYETDEDVPAARIATVSPGFFATFGVALSEGREFSDGDREGAPAVAIVNRAFADRHFPGESPLFEQIRLRDAEGREPWLTVVGVSPTLASSDDPAEDLSRVFVPLAQSGLAPESRLGRWGLRYLTVALRSSGEAASVAPALRDAARAIDPAIPVYDVASFDDVLARATARYRIFGRYYTVFGLAALCLSLVGLYAIMSFGVASRRSEIGIRMALGARSSGVLRRVLLDGLRQVALGLALGAVIAVWLTAGLSRILYGVERWDPWIALGTAGLLALTGLLACLVPALRAASVDPVSAMRQT